MIEAQMYAPRLRVTAYWVYTDPSFAMQCFKQTHGHIPTAKTSEALLVKWNIFQLLQYFAPDKADKLSYRQV